MPNGWRNICWTCFDLSDKAINAIQSVVADGHASYCVYQHEECPTTHKRHLQGFTIFKKQTSWTQVRTLFNLEDKGKIHLEKMRGSILEASNYCKKDESRVPGTLIYESGPCPTKSGDQGKRNDLDDVIEALDAGASLRDIANNHPRTYVRNYKGIAQLKHIRSKPRNFQTMSMVIYGASNSGKSYWVRETYPNALWLTKGATNMWYDDYDDHQVIVFDEFNGGAMPLSAFKRLIDATPLTLDAKGSQRNVKPALVIFLSNDAPSEWYSPELLRGAHKVAFERRLHIIIHVTQQIGLNDEQLQRYRCRMEKCFQPFDTLLAEGYAFDSLSHDESLEYLASSTPEGRRLELTTNLTGGRKFEVGSGGVILSPPTFSTFEPNVTSQLNYLGVFVFSTKDIPAATYPTFLPSPQLEPRETRQVSNPKGSPIYPFQALPASFATRTTYAPAVLQKDPTDLPEQDDMLSGLDTDRLSTASAALPSLKRTKTRHRRGNPYIDDEAECSDDDSSADLHTSTSSSSPDSLVSDEDEDVEP